MSTGKAAFKTLLLAIFLPLIPAYPQTNVAGSDTAAVLLLNKLAKNTLYTFPDSAVLYAQKALKLSRDLHFKLGQVRALNNLSKAYYVKGSYDQSLSLSIQAARISKSIGDKQGTASVHTNIGLIYLAQDKLDPGLSEFLKALKICIETADSSGIATNNFDIGLTYDEKGESAKAISYLENAISISRKISDHRITAMALNRMGETFFHLKNYRKAISYYHAVLENPTYQNDWEYSFAYSGIGQSYFKLGDFLKAIGNAQTGLSFAKKMNAKWDIERSLKILRDSYAASKDYKNAYQYSILEKTYSDSLYSDSKETEINNLHLQQKLAENASLEKENEVNRQKLRINRLVLIAVSLLALLLVIVAGLIYRNSIQKRQLNAILEKRSNDIALQNKTLETINHAKDQLFSIISHDLRSPFASMLQALEMFRSGDLSHDEKDEILEAFYQKLTLTAGLLNNLLHWANNQQNGITTVMTEIDLYSIVSDVVEISSFSAKEKSIRIEHQFEGEGIIHADKDHVKIILQNILGNALKFTPSEGLIRIFYTKTEDTLSIHIKDSGSGISKEKIEQLLHSSSNIISEAGTGNEKGTGIGMMLVRQFAEANDATLNINSAMGEGMEVVLGFRKANFQLPT